jgi:hypothetical protein
MVNNPKGGEKLIQTQIKKYGSKEALSTEMARRARMRKTIGQGGFYDPEIAKKAAAKSAEVRRAKAKLKAEAEDSTEQSQA